MRPDETAVWLTGSVGYEQPAPQPAVIGGRAAGWLPAGWVSDDEGFEPTIVRGRE